MPITALLTANSPRKVEFPVAGFFIKSSTHWFYVCKYKKSSASVDGSLTPCGYNPYYQAYYCQKNVTGTLEIRLDNFFFSFMIWPTTTLATTMLLSAIPIELTLRILSFFDPAELVDLRGVTSFRPQFILPLLIYKIVLDQQLLQILDRWDGHNSISHRALCIRNGRWPPWGRFVHIWTLEFTLELRILLEEHPVERTPHFFLSRGTALTVEIIWKHLGTLYSKKCHRFCAIAVSSTWHSYASVEANIRL